MFVYEEILKWSKELPDSKDLIGDWVGKKCGNYNTKTNKCGGQGS